MVREDVIFKLGQVNFARKTRVRGSANNASSYGC